MKLGTDDLRPARGLMRKPFETAIDRSANPRQVDGISRPSEIYDNHGSASPLGVAILRLLGGRWLDLGCVKRIFSR